MKRSYIFGLLFSISFYVSSQSVNKTPVNILVIMADDMSKSAGIYGDKVIHTPGIDNVGKEGVIFDHAYCTASSCSPSRASILTGMYPHQLEEGGNLWGTLPVKYPNYASILEENGYQVGIEGKGWGPGNFRAGGYEKNPAGEDYPNFEEFMDKLPKGKPFCFWVGSHDPHRPYYPELKNSYDITEDSISLPPWLPENPIVIGDMVDYYAASKRFDQRVEKVITELKEKGLYDQTFIIITSDNGMPFARIKANDYEQSTNVPLVIRWGNHLNNGERIDSFVSLMDLAPTILDVTGIKIPSQMEGKSLLPMLKKKKYDKKRVIFTERERHAKVRKNNVGYAIRSIRTKNYLLINNLQPDRWPAGDPVNTEKTGFYGDIDDGPSKGFLLANIDNEKYRKLVALSVAKRPTVELYLLTKDPYQLINLAYDSRYQKIKKRLLKKLHNWQKETNDPLLNSQNDIFDTYPNYSGKKN